MSAPSPDLPIIVLAAGASARMRGRDKLLEDVDGVPLVRRQAMLARAVSTAQVIVALPPPPHPRYDALAGLDVTLCPVPDAAEGMNASLRRAIATVPEGAPAVMLLLADMPDLTQNDLKIALQSVDFKSETLIWRGVTAAGEPGHPVIFSRALFPAFADLKGDTGGQEIIARAKGKIALIPLPDSDARADLDTPEEWDAWRANRSRLP